MHCSKHSHAAAPQAATYDFALMLCSDQHLISGAQPVDSEAFLITLLRLLYPMDADILCNNSLDIAKCFALHLLGHRQCLPAGARLVQQPAEAAAALASYLHAGCRQATGLTPLTDSALVQQVLALGLQLIQHSQWSHMQHLLSLAGPVAETAGGQFLQVRIPAVLCNVTTLSWMPVSLRIVPLCTWLRIAC